MNLKQLGMREVFGSDRLRQATFWCTVPHTSHARYSLSLLNTLLIHESIDTGYTFIVGTRAQFSRHQAFDLVYTLSQQISYSRKRGKSDYVIEWWNRGVSDSGRNNVIVCFSPPGICDLTDE